MNDNNFILNMIYDYKVFDWKDTWVMITGIEGF